MCGLITNFHWFIAKIDFFSSSIIWDMKFILNSNSKLVVKSVKLWDNQFSLLPCFFCITDFKYTLNAFI